VHRAGDLTAEILLAREDQPRDGRGHGRFAVCPRLGLPARLAGGPGRDDGRLRVHGRDDVGVGGDRFAVAGQRPALALEDLDLRLHEGGPLGERRELDAQLAELGLLAFLGEGGQLVGGRAPPGLVAGGLGADLRDEQVDLAQFAVEALDLLGQLGGELGQGQQGGGR
jgi:hypothetical protein